VYNATNPRDYHRWPEQFPPLQRGVLAGAAANGARLIVMENLYMYGPHGGVPMHEDIPMRGKGMRSTTRRQMTEELFAAHRSGTVRAVSVRASDLLGPHVTESLVGERLFGPLLAGKTAQVLANLDVPHSVSYIADVGRALVEVGADDRAYGQAWHAPNAPAVTLREFIALIAAEAQLTPKVSALPRPLVRALLPLLALSTPQLRGLEENIYISYEPYIVDHSRYAQLFGEHATPLREAIRATIAWYWGENSGVRIQNSEEQRS
jgi:nucleoside-diphosphate-sugar epimerase